MSYIDLRRAYKDAGIDFEKKYQEAKELIPKDIPLQDATPFIQNQLSEWLKEYSQTESHTKNGNILRKISKWVVRLIPFASLLKKK